MDTNWDNDIDSNSDDAQQEAYAEQVAQLVRDFLQMQLWFEAAMPKELAHLKNRLDEIAPADEPQRAANYSLFYRVSTILFRNSNLTMGELSRTLLIPLSTATRMVGWLVDHGYAQRLADPDDRRIVRVALTDSGQRLHSAIESYVTQRVQQILNPLASEERSTFFALFHKVASALKNTAR